MAPACAAVIDLQRNEEWGANGLVSMPCSAALSHLGSVGVQQPNMDLLMYLCLFLIFMHDGFSSMLGWGDWLGVG